MQWTSPPQLAVLGIINDKEEFSTFVLGEKHEDYLKAVGLAEITKREIINTFDKLFE